jgi:hypothetical protein
MKKNKKEKLSLIVSSVDLTPHQKRIVYMPTPPQFVKQRKIRGGGMANYVETGYVIARLNEAFSPIGWDFEIIEQIIEAKEVVVKGKLTIKDYKTGYTISKTQYGTKERYAGVPLGDTLKACASDCLKKCSSLLGIALDIYWTQLDNDKEITQIKKPQKPTYTKEQIFKMSIDKITKENNPAILIEWKNKIAAKEYTEDFTQEQKFKLIQIINEKIGIKN